LIIGQCCRFGSGQIRTYITTGSVPDLDVLTGLGYICVTLSGENYSGHIEKLISQDVQNTLTHEVLKGHMRPRKSEKVPIFIIF
jgi:hypothetical protein